MRHSKLELDVFGDGYLDDETDVDGIEGRTTMEWRPDAIVIEMEADMPTIECAVPPPPES